MWIPRSWRRIRIYLFYKSLGWKQERLFLRESWVVFSIFLLCWKAEFAQTHLSFYATSHSLLFLATLSLSAQHPQNIQKERDKTKNKNKVPHIIARISTIPSLILAFHFSKCFPMLISVIFYLFEWYELLTCLKFLICHLYFLHLMCLSFDPLHYFFF